MAVVRVFLCTYRRNELLRRAVASLQAQTFTDWVCELHNDDPGDPFPAKLVNDLGDPRITAVTHPSNLGPTRTFNLMYRGGVRERYVSLLEDDNWWEPEFLNRLTREMDSRPDIEVGWANMRLWEEQPDGSWKDTGRKVWGAEMGSDPLLFRWPDPRQVRGGVHSHGAMLIRAEATERHRVPDETPSAVIECVRERFFRYPILLVPEALANFAITRATFRGRDRAQWGRCQVLLAASFFRHVRLTREALQEVWAGARRLIDRQTGYILKHARFRDWVRFAASLMRRPLITLRVLRAKTALPRMWEALDSGTRAVHARGNGPTAFASNHPV
jgi:glycosyltransferase involved in cell wall biosynthesis